MAEKQVQATENTNALAVINTFAIAISGDDIKAIISENLGGEKIDQFGLDKVKVPSGGGTQWEIPSITGEVTAPSIDGVIVAWKTVRSLYLTPFTGGGEPPVCSSDDGASGFGDPFESGMPVHGDCATCPRNQWGSSDKGGKKGKACAERRLLFILRKDDHIPLMVVAPPASLKGMKAYFLRLLQAGVPYYGAMTSLTLAKDKSSEGITYSRIEAKALGILDPEQQKVFSDYASFFGKIIQSVRFDPDLVDSQ